MSTRCRHSPEECATEGTTLRFEVDWTDSNGAPDTPSSVQYAVYDSRTGEALLAPTAATPATTTEIVVPPEGTACEPGTRAARRVQLEIVASFGSPEDQMTLLQPILVQPLHIV